MLSLGLIQEEPDQLTVNQYMPGAGIPPHVDTHSIFGEEVISLSLESDVIMEFRHPGGRICPVLLPRRSLLVLTQEARYIWSHGISPRMTDVISGKLVERSRRISLTFRRIRPGTICLCNYGLTWQCDSWLDRNNITRTEQKYVIEAYDILAKSKILQNRPPLESISERIRQYCTPHAVVLDIGCGDGRYAKAVAASGGIYFGIDTCPVFVDVLLSKGFRGALGTQLKLDFANGSQSLVLSLSTLNHLSTDERRRSALLEINRVLGIGGVAIILVKAFEHCRKVYKQQDIFKQFRFDRVITEEVMSNVDFDEGQVFFHLFNEGELENILSQINSALTLIESKYLVDKNVWLYVLRK